MATLLLRPISKGVEDLWMQFPLLTMCVPSLASSSTTFPHTLLKMMISPQLHFCNAFLQRLGEKHLSSRLALLFKDWTIMIMQQVYYWKILKICGFFNTLWRWHFLRFVYLFIFFWQELFYASLEKVSVIFECVCFLPLCDDDEERKFLTGKMSQNLSFYLNKRSW